MLLTAVVVDRGFAAATLAAGWKGAKEKSDSDFFGLFNSFLVWKRAKAN